MLEIKDQEAYVKVGEDGVDEEHEVLVGGDHAVALLARLVQQVDDLQESNYQSMTGQPKDTISELQ